MDTYCPAPLLATWDANHIVGALLLLGLFSLGHAALMIAIANRLHGYRLPYAVLHPVRLVHDLLIFAFPVWLVWSLRDFQPGLDRPPVLLATYGLVCLLIALALPVIALRRALSRPPPVQVRAKSEVIDIAQRLGKRPLGPGPFQFMVHIPGNELLQLEISEKQFALPRVPAAWAGLSILHLTDFHFIGTLQREYFEEVVALGQQTQPDLVVFTGDLLDDPRFVDWLPATLGRLRAPLGCHFVLGNHDWYLTDPAQTRSRLAELGWRDATEGPQIVSWRGHELVIAGTEMPWMGQHPDLRATPSQAFRLLLSHTPDNLPWARAQEFDLVLAGHNHGGQVRLPGFGAVYSPSKYGCRYAAGVFWEKPTLLHVGRGLSGRHPWRWNCRPEITRLVLLPQVEMPTVTAGASVAHYPAEAVPLAASRSAAR